MQRYLRVLSDKKEDGFLIKTCEFCDGINKEHIYMKFDDQYEKELSDLMDPWLIMCMHKMLRTGGVYYIHGKVTSSLLANLEKYCACWTLVMPEYKPISIVPDEEYEDSVKPLDNRAIVSFSGGLDACFTLYRHKKNLAGRNTKNIERAVLLFGATDTPLSKPEDFKNHADNARLLCDDLGVEFTIVETNFCLYPMNWELEHFNVIVAALYFFKKYPYKMTASSLCVLPVSYRVWSSNPITDLMLSCLSSRVISDDVAYDRTMKANVVKGWKLATQKMRVCWEGEDKSKNCGVCEKCIRTMLNFIACGVKEQIEMFPAEAYEHMAKNAKRIEFYPKWQYVRLLEKLEKNNEQNKKYIAIVKRVLKVKQNRHHRHSFWWHLRHMKF